MNQAKIIPVLNCPCTVANSNAYENIIKEGLNNNINIIAIAINAFKIAIYNKNSKFREIFDHNIVLPIPDGVGAIIPMLLINKKKSKKFDFPGFMLDFCNKNNIKCYFLGAVESVNKKAVEIIKETYPGIKTCGNHNGYDINEKELLKDWSKNQTQVVFVAMGSPKQEFLMAKLAEKSRGIFFVGVGGRFDILAKRKKRAPKFFIYLGLEWAYRFAIEPSRLKRHKEYLLEYLRLFTKGLILKHKRYYLDSKLQ